MPNNEPNLNELRSDVRCSSLGGAPMILTAGLVWLITAVVTLLLPLRIAALVTLFQGAVSRPIGLWLLPAILKLPPLPRGHPMISLLVQCALVQTAALPALILVFNLQPAYLPAAMAAVVGAHFLPYAWIQRIPAYAVAGAIIPIGVYVLVLVLHERSFYVVGLFMGAVLLILAAFVRTSIKRPLPLSISAG